MATTSHKTQSANHKHYASISVSKSKKALKDIAGDIIARAISDALKMQQALQAEYDLSESELATVVKELQVQRKNLDPYGDWD